MTLDTTVRPARWPEYFGLAAMAARRLSEVRAPHDAGVDQGGERSRPRRRPLHKAGLWLTVMLSLAAYGGLTTEHGQALATSWIIGDDEWRPVLRAAPAIGLLCIFELGLFFFGPSWTPVATFAVLAVVMFRQGRRWLARADLRDNRRAGAVYIGNLVSAYKGAGRVLLGHIVADAETRGLVTCLEARAHPDLIAYYVENGFTEIRTVDAAGERIVYMERPPATEPRRTP